MERSCVILKDMNAQFHDLKWILRFLRSRTLVFIT